MTRIPAFVFLLMSAFSVGADEFSGYTGRQLMQEVYDRHEQYPYVYEEQSMIMIDHHGNKNTRKLRRYSRAEVSGEANFLLLFDSPVEIKGVALLASRDREGEAKQSFYLPAFGGEFLQSTSDLDSQGDDNFLGTDYSVENLVGEQLDNHRHVRREDMVLEESEYFVVDVFETEHKNRAPLRRHFILKDTFFINRTDHFDDLGRLRKRQTQHDLVNVHGNSWRANMMMMENRQKLHRTVIKIDRRVFSADYVPDDVFSKSWLHANQEPLAEEDPSL